MVEQMQPDHPGGHAQTDADAGGRGRAGRGDGDAVQQTEGFAQCGPRRGWRLVHGVLSARTGGPNGPGERT